MSGGLRRRLQSLSAELDRAARFLVAAPVIRKGSLMVETVPLDVPRPGDVHGRLELAVLHDVLQFDRRRILVRERA